MHATFALAAGLATLATSVVAQAPAGCSSSYSGKFEITAYNLSTVMKRSDFLRERSDFLKKRECDAEGSLTLTLENGILLDAQGRIGYIAGNHQFQFDNPVQPDALSQSGWSACSNGSLALANSEVFYQCLSGRTGESDEQFSNLYDELVFEETCTPALINILPCGGSGGVSQQPDGQVTGPATAPPVTQLSDGQPQASTGVTPITQITDGQIQAPTGTPITQISDGQIQAPTGAPITQISDGQIQAPTGTPITQISDGQIQAPTGAPITQISDGQIQAPTSTGAPITQISDGQIQAPTGNPITQISDGQVQAPTGASNATSSIVPFTGSAASIKAGIFTVFFGVVAVALL